MKKINLYEPFSDEKELEAVKRVLDSGWWKEGPECEKLEEEFCEFTGAKHAISVNSATVGLDLVFKAYNIKDCDVIMPAMTFVATGLAALYNNCNVIFADINRENLTIDLGDVRKKITPNTKAIILQHQSGYPADIIGFEEFKEKGILIIEDAAHGMGSFFGGEHVGARNPSVFSFNVVKNVAAGEGGMITVPDENIAKRLKALRWYGIEGNTFSREGMQKKWDYIINEIGYKYHFNDILASIARVQLKRLPQTNARREMLATLYDELFKVSRVTYMKIPGNITSSRHQYIIRVDAMIRDKMIEHLNANGIGASVHYKPINQYPIFANSYGTPTTNRVWEEMITLPLHPKLTEDDIKRIVDTVNNFYANK